MDLIALIAGVLSVIAIVRSKRIASLEQRAALAEKQVEALQFAVETLERASRADAASGPEPVVTAPSPEPAEARGFVATPAPAESPPLRSETPAPIRGSEATPPAPPVRPRAGQAPPPPRGPRFELPEVDWEKWVGVRGAAVLGGIVLALAGVYFFQYSIEHGLIPPWLRVLSGTLLGLGCIGVAELRLRERYPAAADALIGGGIVVLYATFWAARVLYGMIPSSAAFALMIALTGACTALAYRHASLVIAMIGLVGGFATPMLLATGEDRPIALFSYVLLLDAALLFVARKRGWPVLALVSLVGTLFYQAGWILTRMNGDQILIAVVVLGVFAIAYALAMRNLPEEGRRQWIATQSAAALLPFGFALYLAARMPVGESLLPLGVLMALLAASASWLARMQSRAWLGLGAASAGVAVHAVRVLARPLDSGLAWEAVGLSVLFAAVFHVFVELDRERRGREGPAPAALVACFGLFALLIAAAGRSSEVSLWPWLTGWLALAGLAWRHGGFPGRERIQAAAALTTAAGLWWFRVQHEYTATGLSFEIEWGVAACLAVVLQVLALLRAGEPARRWAERAAALFAMASLLGLAFDDRFDVIGPALGLGAATLFGVLALLASTRMASGRFLLAVTVLTAFAHSLWSLGPPVQSGDPRAASALAIQLASALLFGFWPFAAMRTLRSERFAWYAAALAMPLWFLSLRGLYVASFGDAAIGLLPVGLAAASLGAALLAKRMRTPDDPRLLSNLAWFLAVSCGFVTVAIPLQLEKEWITIGWALEGLAVTLLWKRLDHPGLKHFALALFAGTTLRLVANEAVLSYYPRPDFRIVNWLLYSYLVPAVAMLCAARVLRPLEVPRARPFEAAIYGRGHPVGAMGAGLAALVIVFVWINLAIADWFATGDTLSLSFARVPARDLTTSIAWAIYALGLLALGVRGRSRGLRWISLGLMMVTVAKVFLYDLGELEDLYRVASLLGLALSLIAISLAYQRFVVMGTAEEES